MVEERGREGGGWFLCTVLSIRGMIFDAARESVSYSPVTAASARGQTTTDEVEAGKTDRRDRQA